jgi:hypothetical protein
MLRLTNSPESMRPRAWGRCSGNLVGSGIEEVFAGSGHEATRVGEVTAPSALGEPRAPFGLEGFRESGAVFSA